jgi:hypothetical protein
MRKEPKEYMKLAVEIMKIEQLLGNEELLKLPKTAFLCSRKILASTVLKCYDWAIEQREKGNCVISGFSITIVLSHCKIVFLK